MNRRKFLSSIPKALGALGLAAYVDLPEVPIIEETEVNKEEYRANIAHWNGLTWSNPGLYVGGDDMLLYAGGGSIDTNTIK